MKVRDLLDPRNIPPEESLEPKVRAGLDLDVPDYVTPENRARIAQAISQRLPRLTIAAGNPMMSPHQEEARADFPGQDYSTASSRLAAYRARPGWSQATAQVLRGAEGLLHVPFTKGRPLNQVLSGAKEPISAFVPPPKSAMEQIAAAAGGTVGFAGAAGPFAAALAPLKLAPEAGMVSKVALALVKHGIPAGAAQALGGGGTAGHRIRSGAVMAGAGTALGALEGATQAAPGLVRHVVGQAGGAAVFGGAVPYADYYVNKQAGEKVELPTLKDVLTGIGSLGALGVMTHAAGKAAGFAVTNTGALSRAKKGISEAMFAPPGGTPEQKAVGQAATERWNGAMVGKPITVKMPDGTPVTGTVARVAVYPWHESGFRLLVVDTESGRVAPMEFKDTRDFTSRLVENAPEPAVAAGGAGQPAEESPATAPSVQPIVTSRSLFESPAMERGPARTEAGGGTEAAAGPQPVAPPKGGPTVASREAPAEREAIPAPQAEPKLGPVEGVPGIKGYTTEASDVKVLKNAGSATGAILEAERQLREQGPPGAPTVERRALPRGTGDTLATGIVNEWSRGTPEERATIEASLVERLKTEDNPEFKAGVEKALTLIRKPTTPEEWQARHDARESMDRGAIGKEGVEHPPMEDVALAKAISRAPNKAEWTRIMRDGGTDAEIAEALRSANMSTGMVDMVREGLNIAQKPEAAPESAPPPHGPKSEKATAEGKWKVGDEIRVPYFGRSKKLSSRRATVQGYVIRDGEKLVHAVYGTGERGQNKHDIFVREDQTSKQPKRDYRPIEQKMASVVATLRKRIGGDAAKAEQMAKDFEADAEQFNGVDKEKYAHRMRKAILARQIRDQINRGDEGGFINIPEEVKRAFEGLRWGDKGVIEALRERVDAAKKMFAGAGDDPAKLMSATSSLVRAKQALEAAKQKGPEVDPVVKRLSKAMIDASKVRVEQEDIRSLELGTRAAEGEKAAKGLTGEAAALARRAAHAGAHTKVVFENIRNKFTRPEIDHLNDIIENHPEFDHFDKLSAETGLMKLMGQFGSEAPVESELALLEKAFGSDFVKAAQSMRPWMVKAWDTGLKLANMPRSLMASFDLSAPLRQGIFMIGQPKEFVSAFVKMFRYFGSDASYKMMKQNIAERDTYALMKNAKLFLADMGSFINRREDQFISNLAEELPSPEGPGALRTAGRIGAAAYNKSVGRGVRASGRAYSGFLNQLRADVFDSFVRDAEKAGLNPRNDPKMLRNFAKLINTATGRGEGFLFDKHAGLLNTLGFSPRLIASRLAILNPIGFSKKGVRLAPFYADLDKFTRMRALRLLGAFSGSMLTALSLAKMSGANVEIDPHKADFGKIRIGNTRFDIMGGFQQYVRLGANLWQPPARSNRLEVLGRFARTKEAPMVSFVHDLLSGANAVGGKFNLGKEALSRVTPLVVQDAWDLYKEWGPAGLPYILPGVFGVGVQTYHRKRKSA